MPSGARSEQRKPWRVRFGARTWALLHHLAIRWPCHRCRPNLTVWMEGFHDAVNVRLGKPPFQAESYRRFAIGELEGQYHPACLACLFVRAALRGTGGVASWDDLKPRQGHPLPFTARSSRASAGEKGGR